MNKLKWYLSQIIKIRFHEYAFQNIVCEMAAICRGWVGVGGGGAGEWMWRHVAPFTNMV